MAYPLQTKHGRERCREILGLIVDYIDAEGYPPTLRWLSEETGLSTSNVLHHLDQLERTGEIKRTRQASRGIKVISRVLY